MQQLPKSVDVNRAMIATGQFIEWTCQHIPQPYRALIPVTTSAAELFAGKTQIEKMLAADFEAYRDTPMRHVGAIPRLVDFSDCPEAANLSAEGAIDQLSTVHHPDVFRSGFEGHPNPNDFAASARFIIAKQTLEIVRAAIARAKRFHASPAQMQKLGEMEREAIREFDAAQDDHPELRIAE